MTDTGATTDAAAEALAAAVEANAALRAALDARLAATAARDSAVLTALARGVAVGDLARAMGVSTPVVSRIVARCHDSWLAANPDDQGENP